MLKKCMQDLCDKFILAEKSAQKLALSLCAGVFIAISPTIPLQTPIAFIFAYLFKLNPTIIVSTLWIVNNPIFTLPIYIADYIFGTIVFQNILQIDMVAYNPQWVQWFIKTINKYVNLEKYLGTADFSIWSLIFGGIILGLIVSIAIYPLMLYIFRKIIAKRQSYENNCTK